MKSGGLLNRVVAGGTYVWSTHVPQEWKDATLVPLLKRTKRICDNYRGVALLSVPSKLLALITLERLQAIVESQLL